MLSTRPIYLILLCALLMMGLVSPQLPSSTEQWLATLLPGLLVAVALLILSGCRRFMRD